MRVNIVAKVVALVGFVSMYSVIRSRREQTGLEKKDGGALKQDKSTKLKKPKYHDLTAAITKDTPVFPGDPTFRVDQVNSVDRGDTFSLHRMHMGNHMGTHIDFPAHVIKKGKTSSDYRVDDLVNKGLIIEVPSNISSISRKFVESQNIAPGRVVFFKTRNSLLSKQGEFIRDYVYIEPAAATALLARRVKVVGIDYISVDKYEAEDLPVHKILLGHGVLIVEGLELANVSPGECKIFIMPLKVPNMDGLPVRVMVKI